MGGPVDPYPLYSTRSTLDFKESLMAHLLERFPFLSMCGCPRWCKVLVSGSGV